MIRPDSAACFMEFEFDLSSVKSTRVTRDIYGSFHKWGVPKFIVLQGKIPSKWMIVGYPYFRKPPNKYNHLNLNAPASNPQRTKMTDVLTNMLGPIQFLTRHRALRLSDLGSKVLVK